MLPQHQGFASDIFIALDITSAKADKSKDLEAALTLGKNVLTHTPRPKKKNEVRDTVVQCYLTGLIEQLARARRNSKSDLKKTLAEIRSTIVTLRADFESQPELYRKLIKAYRSGLNRYFERLNARISRRLFLEFNIATYSSKLINPASLSLERMANFTVQYNWEIVEEILSLQSLDERVHAVEDFIYLMKRAFDQGDYVIASIIFSVLFGNSSISRLTQTIESTSAEARAILEEMKSYLNLMGRKRNAIFETCASHTLVSLDYVPKQLDNILEMSDTYNESKNRLEKAKQQNSEEYRSLIPTIAEVTERKEKIKSEIENRQKHVLIQMLDKKIKKQESKVLNLELLKKSNKSIKAAKKYLVKLQNEKLRLLTKKINIQQELRENKILFNSVSRSRSFYTQLADTKKAIESTQIKVENLQNEIDTLSNSLRIETVKLKRAVSFQEADNVIRDQVKKLTDELNQKQRSLTTATNHLQALKLNLAELKSKENEYKIVETDASYSKFTQPMSNIETQARANKSHEASMTLEPGEHSKKASPRSSITQNRVPKLKSKFVFSRETQIRLDLIDINHKVGLNNANEIVDALDALKKYGENQNDAARKQQVKTIMEKLHKTYDFVKTQAHIGFIPQLDTVISIVSEELEKPENNKHLHFDKYKKKFKRDASLFALLKDLQAALKIQSELFKTDQALRSELKDVLAQKNEIRDQEIMQLDQMCQQGTDKKQDKEELPEVEVVVQVVEKIVEDINVQQISLNNFEQTEKVDTVVAAVPDPNPEVKIPSIDLSSQQSQANQKQLEDSITPKTNNNHTEQPPTPIVKSTSTTDLFSKMQVKPNQPDKPEKLAIKSQPSSIRVVVKNPGPRFNSLYDLFEPAVPVEKKTNTITFGKKIDRSHSSPGGLVDIQSLMGVFTPPKPKNQPVEKEQQKPGSEPVPVLNTSIVYNKK